jgi:hypothetical protein
MHSQMNTRCRFGRIAIVGSAFLLFLAGCSTGSGGHPSTGSADTTGSSGLVNATPSLPPPSEASPRPVEIFDRSGRNQAGFSAPSGNIVCAFTAATEPPPGASASPPRPSAPPSAPPSASAPASTDGTGGQVRCEIVVKDWQSPARPASCTADWGAGLVLDTRATMLCASDTIRGDAETNTDGSVILPYGTAIRFAPFTCSSQKSGVDCTNTATGAGFLLGRSGYALRNPSTARTPSATP